MKENTKHYPKIGVALVTLNAEKHLSKCLPPILNSPLKPRVLIIDSSSTDRTVLHANKMGAETYVIARGSFNHGTTRELARKLLKTDIVVFLTQDAYFVDSSMLEKLVEPIANGKASIAYARQIPHAGANIFESFPREYNYPEVGHIRSIADLNKYGVYSYFCSNSCAAYSNQALDEIGGFGPVLLGEDTVAAAKLLRKGRKIAYAAESLVRHSHNYTLLQEFKRYFDTGLARKDYAHLLVSPQKDSGRGKNFAKMLLKKVRNECPRLLPYAILQSLVKFLGYRLGRLSVRAPVWWKRRMSYHPHYWEQQR